MPHNANSMKTCILVDNHFRGGVATVLLTLLRGQSEEDIKFVLVTNTNNPMLENLDVGRAELTEVIPFQFISTSNWFAGTSPRFSKSRFTLVVNVLRKIIKPFLLVHQTFYFARLFKTENFEALLNVNGGYPGSITSRAAALAWSRSCSAGRHIMAIHNFATPSRIGMQAIDRIIDQKVTSAIDEIITVSESCRKSFVNRSSLDAHGKITVIPNGVETVVREISNREFFRKSLNVNTDQPIILMLGSYETRKGHKYLIESFSKLSKLIPSARLVCAGDDPNQMIQGLNVQIRELGLEDSVTLLRFQSDVSELLEACDIVAIPSQSYESFCLVAVEAFRFAKPIVGTTVGAIPEIAPHGLGAILCDPDDVDSFSEALFRLSTDRALYAKYSKLSGARFELFGSEKMMQSYQKSLKGEL